jgi:PIN domain nuclease of toxin-antitoxin system
MSGYLLDTSVVLRAVFDPELLSARTRDAIKRGPNYISVIVYWEVVLKSMKGKLKVGDPQTWWRDAVDQLAGTPLPLHPEHVAAIVRLPPIHQDPFDRAIIAQAGVEDLTLLTGDREMPRYAPAHVRVLR